MAADGTIPVTLIASFHRVRALTADVQLVLDAIRDSDKLQLIGGFKVCSMANRGNRRHGLADGELWQGYRLIRTQPGPPTRWAENLVKITGARWM